MLVKLTLLKKKNDYHRQSQQNYIFFLNNWKLKKGNKRSIKTICYTFSKLVITYHRYSHQSVLFHRSEVKWNIFVIVSLHCMKVKIKEKSYQGDCIQPSPLPPALSKSKQIMQWILYKNHDLPKLIQYQRQNWDTKPNKTATIYINL